MVVATDDNKSKNSFFISVHFLLKQLIGAKIQIFFGNVRIFGIYFVILHRETFEVSITYYLYIHFLRHTPVAGKGPEV
jgi:hypothetical protein